LYYFGPIAADGSVAQKFLPGWPVHRNRNPRRAAAYNLDFDGHNASGGLLAANRATSKRALICF